MKNLIFLIITIATIAIAQPTTVKGAPFSDYTLISTNSIEDSYNKKFDIDKTAEIVHVVKNALGNPVSSIDGTLKWTIESSNFNYVVQLKAGEINISFKANEGYEDSVTIKNIRSLIKSVAYRLK